MHKIIWWDLHLYSAMYVAKDAEIKKYVMGGLPAFMDV